MMHLFGKHFSRHLVFGSTTVCYTNYYFVELVTPSLTTIVPLISYLRWLQMLLKRRKLVKIFNMINVHCLQWFAPTTSFENHVFEIFRLIFMMCIASVFFFVAFFPRIHSCSHTKRARFCFNGVHSFPFV